jgi:hypothetical protein
VTQPKLATVRVYFDADVLGLAKLLCQNRSDFTYPGDPGGRIQKRLRPPCPIIKPGARDQDWIPVVAKRGWLIITRDKQIQSKKAEIDAVRDNGAKMLNLASEDAGTVWAQLEVFMTRWRKDIEPLIDRNGPFIYIATRTGTFRPLSLTPPG